MGRKSAKKKQETFMILAMLITGIAGFGAGVLVQMNHPELFKGIAGGMAGMPSIFGKKDGGKKKK